MNFKYSISDKLLNSIYTFGQLHGKIYSSDVLSKWSDKVRARLLERASLAACSIDSTVDNRKRLLGINDVNNEVLERYSNYIRVKSSLDQFFPDVRRFKVLNINTLHSSILGFDDLDIHPYRHSSRNIDRIVNEGGVFKKIEVKIKAPHSSIPSEMRALADFILSNFSTINPLILAGLIHYKVVELQPFEDGNGRLAYLLSQGVLFMNDIDYKQLLPLEEYYFIHRDRYYDVLKTVIDSGDISPWLEFFAIGLVNSANMVCEEIKILSYGSVDIVSSRYVDLSSTEIKLLDNIAQEGGTSGVQLASTIGVSRQNINKIINKLVNKKIVVKKGKGSGTRYFLKILV